MPRFAGYRMNPTLEPEFLTGAAELTDRQVAQMIDEQLGGWPARCEFLVKFAHPKKEFEDRLATYRFAVREGNNLVSPDGGSRVFMTASQGGEWRQSINRDAYYMIRLSPMFSTALKAQFRKEVIEEIRGGLGKLL